MNENQLSKQSASLVKPTLFGAGIALALISFFLFTAGEPNPEWGKYWRIRPLIIVPLAGALGGAIFYFLSNLAGRDGLARVVAAIFGIIAYIVVLWLGSVLGLDGTYWN